MGQSRRVFLRAVLAAGLLLSLSCLAGCSRSSQTVTEAGSTTLQPVAEMLAEAFMKEHGTVEVVIQGGGSSVGIESCAKGTVDIGASSRELKAGEPDLTRHLLARDAIAVIVHKDNQVAGLTKGQIRDIFAGGITNWEEVGGKDQAIHVAAREEGSGTRSTFEGLVMGDERVTKGAILESSNGMLRLVVAGDTQAISFVSYGYVDSSVKALAIDGVELTAENAKGGTYPLVRPLYFLTRGGPEGLVKEFIDFCLGVEGQSIVEQEGYLSAL